MKIPRKFKRIVAIVVSVAILDAPLYAYGDGMIATSTVVANIQRTETTAKVQNFLQRSEVRQQLEQSGVSPDEVSQRLASLSDTELQQLATQIDQNRAGGDVVVIGLGTILLVVIILLLLKKI
jgi:hypothetical protein